MTKRPWFSTIANPAAILACLLVACNPAARPPTAAPAAPTTAPASVAANPTGQPAASGSLQTVKLQLAWLPGGQFAGEFMAAEKGYYRAVGLDVQFIPGGPSVNTVPIVASGQADIGIGGSAQLLTARNQNIPVKAIGATDDKAPSALSCLPANVKTVADLKGKTVGAAANQRVNLEAMLRINNVDPSQVNVETSGADISSLVAGRIDCRATYINDEPISLQEHGMDPVNLLYYDAGLKQQGDVLYVSEDTDRTQRAMLTRFLQATTKGWQYALANPEESGQTVVAKYAPDADVAHTIAVIKASQPLVETDRTSRDGVLSLDPAVWNQVAGLLTSVGSLPPGFDVASAMDLSIYQKPQGGVE
jgi:NitT/TauT family transport system substrate-binding protein